MTEISLSAATVELILRNVVWKWPMSAAESRELLEIRRELEEFVAGQDGHVIPRRGGDGLMLPWSNKRERGAA